MSRVSPTPRRRGRTSSSSSSGSTSRPGTRFAPRRTPSPELCCASGCRTCCCSMDAAGKSGSPGKELRADARTRECRSSWDCPGRRVDKVAARGLVDDYVTKPSRLATQGAHQGLLRRPPPRRAGATRAGMLRLDPTRIASRWRHARRLVPTEFRLLRFFLAGRSACTPRSSSTRSGATTSTSRSGRSTPHRRLRLALDRWATDDRDGQGKRLPPRRPR